MRVRLGLLAVLAAWGCSNKASVGPPSPDFKKANEMYVEMLAKETPAEVFTDPDITQVRALLAKVPPDSVDADAAKKLQDTISAGVIEAQKAAEEAKKAALASPRQDVAALVAATPPTLPPPAPAVDAGPPDAGELAAPTVGMSAAEFAQKFGGCFSADSPFVDDQGQPGSAYVLNGSCANQYPGMATQAVMVAAGRVEGFMARSALDAQKKQFSLAQQQKEQQARAAAQPPPQPAAPPPVDPNAIDRRVNAPDNRNNVPQNLNSDLDAREKLPGQP